MTDIVVSYYPVWTCAVCGHFHARREDGRIIGEGVDRQCTDCGYCRRKGLNPMFDDNGHFQPAVHPKVD